MTPSAVLIFGPPGSGKSTQAHMLADTQGFEVVDTGRILDALLHSATDANDPEIIENKRRFDAGELVTEAFFERAMHAHIADLEQRKVKCVFGGAPRTLDQAKTFIPELVQAYGAANVHAILLEVSDEVCRIRMGRRLICKVCERPQLFNEVTGKMPEVCTYCGGALYARGDINVTDTRMEVYKKESIPMFPYLESFGITLHHIDGAQTPKAIHDDIVKELVEQ